MQREAILGPPLAPPRYSLLTAVPTLRDSVRWQNGVEWRPENTCTELASNGVVCMDIQGDQWSGGDFTANDDPEMLCADPFVVQAWDRCSTFGFLARDREARVRRLLAARESAAIANEFWSGEAAEANAAAGDCVAGLQGNASKQPAIVTAHAVPASLSNAIAWLDQALADLAGGARGAIYMRPQLLDLAKSLWLIEKDGNVWTTAQGTIVVSDAGFSGDGPANDGSPAAGASQWIYATQLPQVRLSDVLLTPEDFGDGAQMRDATDRAHNTVTVFASRIALITFDRGCAWLAAEVNVPTVTLR